MVIWFADECDRLGSPAQAVLEGAPNRSAIRTSSGSDPAFIFRMTCPR